MINRWMPGVLEALPYLVVDSLTRRCLSLMMQQVSNMTQEAVHQAEQLFYEKVRQPKRDPREIQEYQKAYAQTDYVPDSCLCKLSLWALQ